MSERSKEIAATILAQLGGAGRLKAMIGAGSFAHGNFAKEGEPTAYGLSFRIAARAKRGIKAVVIKLNGRDLYDVDFGKVVSIKDPETGFMVSSEYRVLESADNIDCESLKSVIEHATGLLLSLR